VVNSFFGSKFVGAAAQQQLDVDLWTQVAIWSRGILEHNILDSRRLKRTRGGLRMRSKIPAAITSKKCKTEGNEYSKLPFPQLPAVLVGFDSSALAAHHDS
jgi:hypothetical protein